MSQIIVTSENSTILKLNEVDWLLSWAWSNESAVPLLGDVDAYAPTVYGEEDVTAMRLELERALFAQPSQRDKLKIFKLLKALRTHNHIKNIIFNPLA